MLREEPPGQKGPFSRGGTQKADVYSFAIILYENSGRAGPYGDVDLSPKGMVLHVFISSLDTLICQLDIELSCLVLFLIVGNYCI